MLKKTLLIVLLTLTSSLYAQTQTKFGYISYAKIVKALPEYEQTQNEIEKLKIAYYNEIRRSENEFNAKYAEFLEGQKKFPKNILLKRQKELQVLMNESMKYRDEVKEVLSNAEKELIAPLFEKVKKAIRHISIIEGLSYVINTDNDNLLFVNEQIGVNLEQKVLIALGVIKLESIPPQENKTIELKEPTDSTTVEGNKAIEETSKISIEETKDTSKNDTLSVPAKKQ